MRFIINNIFVKIYYFINIVKYYNKFLQKVYFIITIKIINIKFKLVILKFFQIINNLINLNDQFYFINFNIYLKITLLNLLSIIII